MSVLFPGGHFGASPPTTSNLLWGSEHLETLEVNQKLKINQDLIVDNIITNRITVGDTVLTDGLLTNLDMPLNPGDAASKEYVDSVVGNTLIPGDGIDITADIISVDTTVMRNNSAQQIFNTTQSTDATTGCLVLDGGLGVAKDVYCDGVMNSLFFNAVSDFKLKKEVKPIDNAMGLIKDIDAVQYKLKKLKKNCGIDSKRTHYGVIAQDLQKKV